MIGTNNNSATLEPQMREPMKPTEDQVQAAVSNMASEAWQYVDEEMVPKWEEAIKFYKGEPFGNEEDGRSQVVSTDVRDTIQAALPSLLRFFCGSERPMEARPRGKEDIEKAEEQTEYANLVLFSDNPGFRVMHDWLLNGLREGFGVVKAWWDPVERIEVDEMTGLSAEDLVGLSSDPRVELSDVKEKEDEGGEPVYAATVTRIVDEGRIRIATVPPEEFIINRNARSDDDALLIGHRREIKAGELVDMGYDPDTIQEHLGDADLADEMEYTRNEGFIDSIGEEGYQFATRKVLYTELWTYLDLAGDGKARLFKVCTVGETYKILKVQPANEVPFAYLIPLPEPHTFFGQAWSDLVKDTQKIKSAIQRGMLDSLNLTLNPRMVVLEGQVDMDDVLNNEIGAVIRARVQNAVTPMEHRFVGDAAMPVLEYMDTQKEQRTGQSRAAQGLNADSLQSATKMAVSATVSAAQQRIELLARIFAETGVKQLYKLILKLARRHQQKARMVKLRGEWTPVDPGNWDTELDFEVIVGLGAGTAEERKALLSEIGQEQAMILQQLGPANPIVSLGQLRYTLASKVRLGGFPDPDRFYKQVDDAALEAEAQRQAQQPPEPTPEEKLAQAQMQIEQMKIQSDQAAKQAEIQFKERELQAKSELERQKMLLEFELKKAELEMKYTMEVETQRAKIAFEQQRIAVQTEGEREKMALQREKAGQDLQITAAKAAQQQEIAQQQATERPTEKE